MVDGPTKITNLDDSPLDHDILRFNVSMDNFESVQIPDPLTNLSQDRHDDWLCHVFIVYLTLLDEVEQLSLGR